VPAKTDAIQAMVSASSVLANCERASEPSWGFKADTSASASTAM